MDRSDSESGSEVVEIEEPQDLFYDEADEDESVPKEDEAEEEPVKPKEEKSKSKVENKSRVRKVRGSRGISDKSLTKPSGLPALKKLFENFKFKGSGHEEEDLSRIMAILQRWMCYQLCPSYDFESCMRELEMLGKKRIVQTLMRKYRMGIEDWGEKNPDDVDQDEQENEVEMSEPARENNFDMLLNEKTADVNIDVKGSPASGETETEVVLTQEQLERIARNRKLAEERRIKRMSQLQTTACEESTSANDSEIIPMELDYT